jgi:hypothetical protein
METPKRFFELLRADYRRFHRVFAERLGTAGFEVRRIRKRSTGGIWEVAMRRGSVRPGTEQQMMRRVICGVLASFGVKCPLRDVDFYVRGDRMSAAFAFDRGTTGSLSYFKNEEKWSSEPWP